MGVSDDAPSLDSVYKLAAYAGRARLKLSTGKTTLPGRKQVWRFGTGTKGMHDVVGLEGESLDAEALLVPVMEGGSAWRRGATTSRRPGSGRRRRDGRSRPACLGSSGRNRPIRCG